MIYYSKELKTNTKVNTIIVELEDDEGYLYISSQVYDQLVIFSDRANCNKAKIFSLLGMEDSQVEVSEELSLILPPNLMAIVSYTALLDKNDVNLLGLEREDLFAILSSVANSVDLLSILGVPYSMRAKIKFSKMQLNLAKRAYKDYENSFKEVEVKTIIQQVPQEVVTQVISPQVEEPAMEKSVSAIAKLFEDDDDDYIPLADRRKEVTVPKVPTTEEVTRATIEEFKESDPANDIVAILGL